MNGKAFILIAFEISLMLVGVRQLFRVINKMRIVKVMGVQGQERLKCQMFEFWFTININDRMTEYKRKWNEHLTRMEESRIPKIASDRERGKRYAGRPKKKWKDDLQ